MFTLKKIGDGNPKIAIVGCVHGDEIIGEKVIKELTKIKLQKGDSIIKNSPAPNLVRINTRLPARNALCIDCPPATL